MVDTIINKTKIVHIYRRYGGLFAKANKAVTHEGSQHIGSSVNGKRVMMLNEEEMKSYMPQILGIQPNNTEFLTKLNHYWDSLTEFVPEQGMGFEIGISYDASNTYRKETIDALFAEHNVDKKDRTSAKLAEIVEETIRQEDKWKYGIPLSAKDYSTWKYCLNYRDVANTIQDVDKSKHIRFYIHDESVEKAIKDAEFKLRNDATKKYVEIISKPDMVSTILYAAQLGDGAQGRTTSEQAQMLENLKNEHPKRFIELANAEDLQKVAYIEKLIANHILERDIESGYIKNPTDGIVIGTTVRNTIAALAEEKNVKLANELQGRLKGQE